MPFSQSLRALRHDRSGFGRWLALAGVLLLGGWVVWFATAGIPLYETSSDASLLSSTEAEAVFSPAAAARIRPGQEASLRVDGRGVAKPAVLPARVTAVQDGGAEGAVRVRLALQPSSASAGRPDPGATGSVAIRVARLTPAQLFLQAAGREPGEP